MSWRALAATVACFLSIFATTVVGAAEKRIALVIGNSAYKDAPLANPANDARLMAKTLGGLGFEVIEVLDANQKAMKRAVRDFGARIERAGKDTVGLFYYAGHGVQVKGENFLIPVGAPIAREADVSIEAVSAGAILEQLSFAKNRLNIVILDACRNNPFKRSFRSASRGLARMDAPTGSIVAYSTAPGRVASDGDGQNGPYTEALARAMQRPGLKVEDVFKLTRRQVIASTAEQQVPWESSSLVGDFYFSGDAGAGRSEPIVALTSPVSPDAVKRHNVPDAAPKTDGATFRDCPDCPELVSVPAGSFRMGSAANEIGRAAHEGPQRTVKVPRFALGKYEITRGQFAAFVKATGYSASGGCWYWLVIWHFDRNRSWKKPGWAQTDEHPVSCINWEDARAYTLWLSQKTGHNYRLPTEAEWEYAARAGTESPRFWGHNPRNACKYGNVYDRTSSAKYRAPWAHHDCEDGYAETAPVGKFQANAFGLHDMLGNAPEWVTDCWRGNYKNAPTDGAAFTNSDCKKRTIRGGSWAHWPDLVRSATREHDEPYDREIKYGFRVVRELR